MTSILYLKYEFYYINSLVLMVNGLQIQVSRTFGDAAFPLVNELGCQRNGFSTKLPRCPP